MPTQREQITTLDSLKTARAFGFYVREQLDARILFPNYLLDQMVARAAELELDAFEDLLEILPEFPDDFQEASKLTDCVFMQGQELDEFCDLLEFILDVSLDTEV